MRTMPIHYKIADKIVTLLAKGHNGYTKSEKVTNGKYSLIRSTEESFYIRQEISIIDISIYNGIDINTIKLLVQIQQELKVNNPIWICTNKDKTQIRLAIAQLKEKDILESIGDDIYIVNPEKIRRGKPLACLAALYVRCKGNWERNKNWKLSINDIKDLKPPEDSLIEQIRPEIGYGYSDDRAEIIDSTN